MKYKNIKFGYTNEKINITAILIVFCIFVYNYFGK